MGEFPDLSSEGLHILFGQPSEKYILRNDYYKTHFITTEESGSQTYREAWQDKSQMALSTICKIFVKCCPLGI